ncbi:GPW/gp25 family protein [Acidovorax delafieldii]|uniref:GPW/gp25 family protein n=1 Tax=Acidovorax delafieldii TaxID=47920 RepID=UPI00286B2D66|nr:GPW/gp25 family protein [Acidovorax delafieldii]
MDMITGRAVADLDHLRQSIRDIITTPVGTRLERRTYGSLLPDLIDYPDNGATRVRIYAAVASALMKWEPRLRLSRVALSSGPAAGQATLDLSGEYIAPTGSRPVNLQVALQQRAAA